MLLKIKERKLKPWAVLEAGLFKKETIFFH